MGLDSSVVLFAADEIDRAADPRHEDSDHQHLAAHCLQMVFASYGQGKVFLLEGVGLNVRS